MNRDAANRGERPPWSALAIDGPCVAFAPFTVLCNGVVLLSGSAGALRIALGVAVLAGLAAGPGLEARARLVSQSLDPCVSYGVELNDA